MPSSPTFPAFKIKLLPEHLQCSRLGMHQETRLRFPTVTGLPCRGHIHQTQHFQTELRNFPAPCSSAWPSQLAMSPFTQGLLLHLTLTCSESCQAYTHLHCPQSPLLRTPRILLLDPASTMRLIFYCTPCPSYIQRTHHCSQP